MRSMESENTLIPSPQRGSALAAVLLVVIPMAVLATLLISTISSVTEHVEYEESSERLHSSASAALDLAMVDVWRDYQAAEPGDLMGDFRGHLDFRGFLEESPLITDAGVASGLVAGGTEGLLDLGLEFGFAENALGTDSFGDVTIQDLRFERQDFAFWTTLTASATVGFGTDSAVGDRARVDHMYFVEGLRFDDFEYAMISNSVGCLLCHARIDTTANVYGRPRLSTNGAADAAAVQADVAVLGELRVRALEVLSELRGELVFLGNVVDGDGSPVDWAMTTLERVKYNDVTDTDEKNRFSTADARDAVVKTPALSTAREADEDGDENASDVAFDRSPVFGNGSDSASDGGTAGGGAAGGRAATGGGVFGGGGAAAGGGEGQVGGEGGEQIALPLSAQIPPAFPDDNGNRVIDAAEYDRLAAEATGSLGGGAKVGVARGGRYPQLSMPSADQVGLIESHFDGHLVLSGTEQNPILLDGRVVVDGDVVVSGFIKGEGEIVARGNVYMPGPVIYLDGDEGGYRTFGTAADGTVNRAAFAAGGSILVGDWVPTIVSTEPEVLPANELDPIAKATRGTVEGGAVTTSKETTVIEEPLTASAPQGVDFAWNFTICQMMIFNREEWTKTQPLLPGPQGQEVSNPLFDSEYVPRYYRLGDGGDVYIFTGATTWFDPQAGTWVGEQYPSGWNENSYQTLSSSHIAATSAVVNDLLPENSWLPPQALNQMSLQLSVPHAGTPLEVDGLMYSGNAMFFAVMPESPYMGQALLNGSVVVTHAGLLAPGATTDPGSVGFRLNFDSRQKKGIVVHDNSQLVFRRGVRIH